MGINFLPYKSLVIHAYHLAKRSSANRDEPFYVVFMLTMGSIILNTWTFSFIIEGLFYKGFTNYNLYITFTFGFFVLFLYLKNKRFDLLAKSFEQNKNKPKLWQSIIYLIFRYLIDASIMFIAALYKNGDWIFS
jgi:hypothetical protein